MVVSTILATDMGLHFDYVGKIKEQTERLRIRNTPEGSIPKPNQASIDEQERLVLCGTLIKCADISNAVGGGLSRRRICQMKHFTSSI